MAATKVVVDPITRIEGHLRIEVQADQGKITDSWASSTQFRGIEIIMEGRDPRDAWAFTQRICGVCTVVHAVASCRAVEDALDITIPPNANLIRNLIHGMQFVQDHVIHFYHLHALDWVDVVSALKADPEGTAKIAKSISPWPNNSATYFAEVQNRLKTFVSGGQLGIFTNGYWGHPAYKLPPEVNLLAVAHYLEALDWQRDVIRLHTIFGGKNPHPNFLVGGMASAINLDDTATINAVRFAEIQGMITRAQRFVEQVYFPDLLAIAGFYKDWGSIGGGVPNYMTYGEFPAGDDQGPRQAVLPPRHHPRQGPDQGPSLRSVQGAGVHQQLVVRIRGRGRRRSPSLQRRDQGQVHRPADAVDLPAGREEVHLDEGAPVRRPADAGRAAVADAGRLRRRPSGDPGHCEEVLGKLQVGPAALFSTLGRTAARGIETAAAGPADERLVRAADRPGQERRHPDLQQGQVGALDLADKEVRGYGFLDAPRGALGHWVQIENGKITQYQCVVPSTWNCSPRDGKGQMGPYEAALIDNHPLLKPDQPLEILRTIHSFDPCMACGVHVLDTDGNLVTEVKVQ